MKDNILNNTKNVEDNDIKYKFDGPMSQSVHNLLKYSKDGNYDELKKLIEEKEFQGSTLNLALRNLIVNLGNINNPNYIECFKLLLSTNIDLNYKFENNNSTILMKLTELQDIEYIKELLDAENKYINKYINQEANKFYNIEEEEIYEMEQKEKFFCQKDLNNNNFFNYLCVSKDSHSDNLNAFEYIYENYPFQNNRKVKISKKIREIFDRLLIETNNDGNNLMNLALIYKCPKLVLKLIEIKRFVPNINKKKENYIHSAVRGDNIICLKIMLCHCDINDLASKNTDMLTPAQLAYKLGFITLSNIITEFQNNYNEDTYKDIFLFEIEKYISNLKENSENNESSDNIDNTFSIDLLVNYNNYKFKILLYQLKYFKIINHLCIEDLNANDTEEDLSYKKSYINIEWNIIMTKMKLNLFKYEKDDENNTTNNTCNNNKIKYNKKKSKKIEEKNKNTIYPFLRQIQELNENITINKFILPFNDMTNSIETNLIKGNENIDILIYNKIIFLFKIGNYECLINVAEIYLPILYKNADNKKNEKDNNKNINYRALILYVNITCILIEVFIYQGYSTIAEIIIKALDNYLYTKSLTYADIIFTLNDKIILDYLNKSKVLNPFLSDWNILFNYSNFLKLLINKSQSRENIEDLRRKLDDISKKDVSVVKRLQMLFNCIEIKKLYEKEDDKIYNKVSDLRNMGIDSEIYYCNIVGVIFLKKKKYNLSKIFFQQGLNKYIQIIKNKIIKTNKSNEDDNDDDKFVNFRNDYITAFLYNISLCHFYLGEYNKCIEILEKLLVFQNNKNNFFFYYRLGICYLQLYIRFNKNTNDYFNNNILKLIGYKKNKINNQKNRTKKSLSFESDNDSNENSANQLDRDFNKAIEEQYDIYNSNEINNKKIIIKNSTKFINNEIFIKNNSFDKHDDNQSNIKEQNENQNNKIKLLQKAIKCFKKILIISKSKTHTNSIKSMYNFYLSKINKENITEKDNINNNKGKKIPVEIIIDTYLNLLMCLSLKNNWLEMILIIKDYNKKKIFTNRLVNLKILLFKLEAYANLDNSSKIKEIIQKLKSYKNIELSAFNKKSHDIINNINIKLYLYYTIILIHIKEKNYKEMDIYTDKLLLLIKNETNIPYYIIDLLINAFLIKLNNEPNINEKNKIKYNKIILNLIKRKKTFQSD